MEISTTTTKSKSIKKEKEKKKERIFPFRLCVDYVFFFSPSSTKTSILVKNQKYSLQALTNLMMLSNFKNPSKNFKNNFYHDDYLNIMNYFNFCFYICGY
jgi:hypothetical protein